MPENKSELKKYIGKTYVCCSDIQLLDPDGDTIELSPGDKITFKELYSDSEGEFAVVSSSAWRNAGVAYMDLDFFTAFTWIDSGKVK